MRDSNPRILVPETSALPLGQSPLWFSHAPTNCTLTGVIAQAVVQTELFFSFDRNVSKLPVDFKYKVADNREENCSEHNSKDKTNNTHT